MAKIIIDENFCEGCGICVEVCPKKIISLDKDRISAKGYHPAHCVDMGACTGCKSCAIMCPDCAIVVER